ncbi:MAG TPA: FkbM family methyltransferase [Kaistia sp.]|nr:FkbM family methyltransferase [Kaistia sp.]
MITAGSKYLNGAWWYNALNSRFRDAVAGIAFSPHVETLSVNDIAFQFYVATSQAKNWYAHGDMQSHEMRAVLDLVEPHGATVFECGGHHGRDCVVLAYMIGEQGRIVTFEPHPDNARIIERNVELNDLTNVTVVNAAVGSATGELHIRDRSNAKVSLSGGGIRVPVETLDDWSSANLLYPDFIKIDVEGYEFEVLRGAANIIRDRSPAVLVELHCDLAREFGNVPDDIWGFFDSQRYFVHLQQDDSVPARIAGFGDSLSGRPHLYFVPRNAAHLRAE